MRATRIRPEGLSYTARFARVLQLFYLRPAHLVFCRLGDVVVGVFGQLVYGCLGKVHGYPDDAFCYLLRNLGTGGDAAAAAAYLYHLAVGDAQRFGVRLVYLDKAIVRLVDDAARPPGHRSRVVMVEGAPRGE